MMVDFIRSMILDTMGKEGMRFFPFIATLFIFILFCNLIGMIPGSYTVTSQIIVTAVFSFRGVRDQFGGGVYVTRREVPGHSCPTWYARVARAVDDSDRDHEPSWHGLFRWLFGYLPI
jgi:hypothetical protein